MDVAVIVPLYNKEEYIARAIDSILRQTYQDLELVIVDDGSTDNGPDVVRQYRDSRFRLIQQANAGPGAARNRGISESSAPLLAFLDADDEWLPTFLEESIHALKHNPECVFTNAASLYGPNRTSMISQLKRSGVKDGVWRLSPKIRTFKELSDIYTGYHTATMVCRRSVVEQYGGFYSKDNCLFGEDPYLIMQMLLGHHVYRIMKPLVWIHTEASDLSFRTGRKVYPIEPCFMNPIPMRDNCLPEYRSLLDYWLACKALKAASMHIDTGNLSNARYLIKAFPLMRTWRWEYLKVKSKLSLPLMTLLLRIIKRATK